MADHENEAPVDPFVSFVERLQFASPDEAGPKLRNFLRQGVR
jgi:hypothetical protein